MTPTLNENRAYGASAEITVGGNEYKLIVGGNDGSTGLATVEAFNGNSWSNSIISSLQYITSDECIVKLDENTLFVMGGVLNNNRGPTRTTFFYDVTANKWTSGNNKCCMLVRWFINKQKKDTSEKYPLIITKSASKFGNVFLSGPLLFYNNNHFPCGVLKWNNNGTIERVVVAGGGRSTYSVQTFNYDQYLQNRATGFVIAQDPGNLKNAKIVEFNGSLIMIGGQDRSTGVYQMKIFQMTDPNGPWILLTQTLEVGRITFIAIPIPDSLLNCN